MASNGSIPLKRFGKTDVQISALGLGGHHLGAAKDEQAAVAIVHDAMDGGVTFFDCCWEYNRGKSEDWLGKGLKGRRDKAFLMTKVCTHGRDATLATQMLEQSLRSSANRPLRPMADPRRRVPERSRIVYPTRRSRRSPAKAKKDGKVRFVGFTGHKDPEIHLAMLNTGFPVRRCPNAAESLRRKFHPSASSRKSARPHAARYRGARHEAHLWPRRAH